MKKTLAVFSILMLLTSTAFADYTEEPKRESSPFVVAEHEHPGNQSNFYIPLEAEANITPQQFRNKWFQGIFAMGGAELAHREEPVWFAGARAKFDLFPAKEVG